MAVHFQTHMFMIMIFLISSKVCKITADYSAELCPPMSPVGIPLTQMDVDMLQFAENLEYLEAEYFLWGALGAGLEEFAPQLNNGGPPPIGARRANLDSLTQRIIEEFGFQEVGHLRALNYTVGLIPKPLLDIRPETFATLMNEAFGYELDPPFDPYRNSINYMLASYIIPYEGLVGYVGANQFLQGYKAKRLLAGLLGVESGQDAVIRTYLYERAEDLVYPYNHTVAEFTVRISELRNVLARCGIKDEGLFVLRELGAEMQVSSNILSANNESISYARTPEEILRTVYNTGNESMHGGFYPEGANGRIARQYLE